MTEYRYSIHDLVTLRLRGADCELARQIDDELAYFRTEQHVEEPDFDIEIESDAFGGRFRDVIALGDGYFFDRAEGALVSTGLGGGSQYQPSQVRWAVYGDLLRDSRYRIVLRAADRPESMVRRSGRAFLRCDPMTLAAADAARFFYRVFEPLLYLKLPSRGATLLHAGAVARDGGATLIFGVRDVGKTSTTIDLVRNGHEFMADDLCILRSDGMVFSYPKPLKLEGDLLEKREWTGMYTSRLSWQDRWAWFLAWHSPRRKPFWLSLKLHPWQLGRGAEVRPNARLADAVFLWKSNRADAAIEAFDSPLAAGDAVSHVIYEFNGMPRHHAYYHALALLNRADAQELDRQHIEWVRGIVGQAFARATCHEIVLGGRDNFALASKLIRGMRGEAVPGAAPAALVAAS
ncbi:MAG: hypothetical protein HY682_04750 [Chloroflexi bacterium]|nr:hypothetical protein [Chloroflexota bacterium]